MGASAPEDAGDVDAGSPRPAGLGILAIGGVVLVLLIAVAAVLSASRGPATFEEGSPEAVVQGYLDAMIKGDESAAHASLSDELGDDCTVRDLRTRSNEVNNARVALRAVSIDGDEAEVEVSITENAGDVPFGGGGYTFEETFVLAREAGTWVIVEEPWPIYFCS